MESFPLLKYFNIHCVSHSDVFDLLRPQGLYHQAPLSMEFSRQEYWSGLPFPPPGDLPDPGTELDSLVSCIGRQALYHQHHLGSLYHLLQLLKCAITFFKEDIDNM